MKYLTSLDAKPSISSSTRDLRLGFHLMTFDVLLKMTGEVCVASELLTCPGCPNHRVSLCSGVFPRLCVSVYFWWSNMS